MLARNALLRSSISTTHTSSRLLLARHHSTTSGRRVSLCTTRQQLPAATSLTPLASSFRRFSSSRLPSTPDPEPVKKVHIPHLDFSDPRAAFRARTTPELWRSLVVFTVCGWGWLVKAAPMLLKVLERTIGRKHIGKVPFVPMFFSHFCAGESIEGARGRLLALKEVGVGSILDYAAEADVSDKAAKPRRGVVSAKVFDYAGEEQCDENLERFLASIEEARCFERGFMAIKLTALGKPDLLERCSKLLVAVRQVWQDRFEDGKAITLEEWKNWLDEMHVDLDDDEAQRVFMAFDTNGDHTMDYVEWTESLELSDLTEKYDLWTAKSPARDIMVKKGVELLDEVELQLVANMIGRLERLAEHASGADVRLMIDAEQTYLQPAISHFTGVLQKKYNRDKALIYNTYQCYLKRAEKSVKHDLERAKRNGYYFGGKMVRGAYLVLERELAAKAGRPSPIHETIEDTHQSYHACLDLVFENIARADLMVASHNVDSVEYTIELMSRYSVDRETGGVSFGQLLGMSDPVTFVLGSSKFQSYKYLPYGPIGETLPYLVRRLQENSSILARLGNERSVTWAELKARKFFLPR